MRWVRDKSARDGDDKVIAVADPDVERAILEQYMNRELSPGVVEIHTLGWNEDQAVQEEGDRQGATLYCIVYVDGHELDRVSSAEVRASSDFTEVVLTLCPSSVRIVEHSLDTWPPTP